MNLSFLTTRAMLAHSGAWLADPAVAAALGLHQVSAALLAEVATAHEALARNQDQRVFVKASVAALSAQMAIADADHDRFARALFRLLEALADTADTAEQVAAYTKLRDRLFPSGLEIIIRSYVDEAGEVVAREQRLEPADHALMAATPIGDRTLADLYARLSAAGRTLGELARESARHRASLRQGGTARTSSDVQVTRRRWIQVVSALFSTLDLVPVSAEVVEAIVGPVAESVRSATRRRAAGASAGDDAGGGAGAGDDGIGDGQSPADGAGETDADQPVDGDSDRDDSDVDFLFVDTTTGMTPVAASIRELPVTATAAIRRDPPDGAPA